MSREQENMLRVVSPGSLIFQYIALALLHKDRKYGNNKRVAQETYSKGRDE